MGASSRKLGPRREFLIVTAAFLAILVALFWRVVLRQEVLVPADILYFLDPVWQKSAPPAFVNPANTLLSDQIFMYYPWRVFATESLRLGIIPLWNPFVLGGTPFLANQQSAVLYPLNLLLLALPLPVGIGYLAIARLFIAELATYYYLRTIGVGRSGSFIGGCAFALGGFSMVWLGSPLSNVVVLLPLTLLLTECLLRKPSGLRFAGLALVIGAQLLGGHPETSFHVGLVWAIYAAFRLTSGWRSGEWQGKVKELSFYVVAAGLVGIAVASIQVLPFLAILSEASIFATRQGLPDGNWLWRPEFWKDMAGLITLLFPNAFGNPSLPYGAPLNPLSNFSEQAVYVGTVPLLLAVVASTMWRRNRFVCFWLVAAIVAAGVAFHVPAFETVYHLPILGLVFNERLRLAVTLSLAILSGFGMDLFIKSVHDVRFLKSLRRWLAIAVLVGLAGTLAFFALLPVFAGSPNYNSMVQFYRPASFRLAIPVYVAAILWLALWLLSRKRLGHAWLKGCATLLAIGELSLLAYPYNPSLDAKQLYPGTESVRFLRERVGAARVAGVGFALMPNGSMVWNLRDVRGYEMTTDRRFQAFYDSFARGMPYGAYNLLADADGGLLDLLGVKYIVAQSGSVREGPALVKVFDEGGVDIFENRNALPRAFLVGRARQVGDDGQVLEAMRSPDFKPREEVLLDAWAPAPAARVVNGRAEVSDISANEVEVKVVADAPSWLVLSDTYDGGWKAYVDGEKADIYRANYVMRAVRVGAAEHRVRFVYDPPAYSLGRSITLTALASLALVIFYALLKKIIPALLPRALETILTAEGDEVAE